MNENLLIMHDDRLEELGMLFRHLCICQGRMEGPLQRGREKITFEQFIIDRNHARELSQAAMLWAHKRGLPVIDAMPI